MSLAQPFPATTWVLRKLRRPWVVRSVTISFLFLISSYRFYRLQLFRSQAQVASVLRILSELEVDKTIPDDLKASLAKFPFRPDEDGCSLEDCRYSMQLTNYPDSAVGERLFTRAYQSESAWNMLHGAGVRFFYFSAAYIVKRGTLTRVSYYVTFPMADRAMAFVTVWGTRKSGTLPPQANDNLPFEVKPYFKRPSQQVHIYFTPEATREQQKHAFSFEPSCISRLNTCDSLAEIIPEAWKDYEGCKTLGGRD